MSASAMSRVPTLEEKTKLRGAPVTPGEKQ
jgi:hypothetical protein